MDGAAHRPRAAAGPRAISDAVGAERLCPSATPGARVEAERFRVARGVVLLLVVTGASAGARAIVPGSYAMFGACLACIGAAVVVEHLARRRLHGRLVEEAKRTGYDEAAAEDRARSIVERIVHGVPDAGAARRRDMELPDITITEADLERLAALVEALGPSAENGIDRLDEELGRARVVSPTSVGPDVVTMNSRVKYLEELDGVTREITLVYPAAADAGEARVSVLAPVGSALLGLRVGQAIDWPLPDGRRKRYRVVEVPYQPEAAGHYHL